MPPKPPEKSTLTIIAYARPTGRGNFRPALKRTLEANGEILDESIRVFPKKFATASAAYRFAFERLTSGLYDARLGFVRSEAEADADPFAGQAEAEPSAPTTNLDIFD